MSSMSCRCCCGFCTRRDSSWKNFSPPQVSLWNITSKLCDDQMLPPHGVSAAASSTAVHRQ